MCACMCVCILHACGHTDTCTFVHANGGKSGMQVPFSVSLDQIALIQDLSLNQKLTISATEARQ